MEFMQFIVKTMVSAFIIGSIATISKRLPTLGAIIASLPLTSILAMIWLYQDTKDVTKVITLSNAIFWMVIPSLVFFLVLPVLLRKQVNFHLALLSSSLILIFTYSIFLRILRYFNIKI